MKCNCGRTLWSRTEERRGTCATCRNLNVQQPDPPDSIGGVPLIDVFGPVSAEEHTRNVEYLQKRIKAHGL